MRRPIRVVAVGLILLAATSASAQIPQLIRYQGTLVDANNVPLEGSYTLTFRLYDAATAGNILWTETQTAVPVTRGVFNVLLGSVAPLNLPFDKDSWLSTQVGTDAEMSPRQRLTSVPYAYRAEVANRAKIAESLDTTPKFEVDTGSILTNGLVAYWKLDESSGSRADSKGSNGLTDTNTVTQAAGKQGQAAQLTSANSEYLSIADNADLSMGDIDFTIAAWVYLDSIPSSGVEAAIVGKFDGDVPGDREYLLYAVGLGDSRAQFKFAVRSAGGTTTTVQATNFGDLSTATWYFVVAWHDSVADTINISVNNGSANSAAHSAGVADTTQEFLIGSQVSAGQFWNGRIDEVGFWKRALTAQERADLYNAGNGNTYTAPAATPSFPKEVSTRAYNSGNLSIPHNVLTNLTFNSERWDTDNMHSTTANTSRLTAPVAGKYFITCHAIFATNGTGYRRMRLVLNQAFAIARTTVPATSTSGETTGLSLASFYQLAANDYVECDVQQDSGGGLSVVSFGSESPDFGMVRIPSID